METPLLKDIVIIIAISIPTLLLCHRLRVPAIVGFLVAGVLAGPYGLRLVSAVQEVESLAEGGIVLLLFTIGIEFSFRRMLQIKRSVLVGGPVQVVLTVLVGFAVARQLGLPVGQALFLGFLVSLSSTAILLKLLQDRAEVDSPHGRTTLGILIFQDIVVVPMILLTPLLAGVALDSQGSAMILVVKVVLIVGLVAVSARWVVPKLLHQIARTRSRELFILSVILICLGIAWATSRAGLSLALGAFLAGLVISESEYSHHALDNIMPFKDVFTSLFFVSVGMLLDVGFFVRHPAMILLIALGVLVAKSLIAGFTTSMLGLSFRTSILVGLGLCQVGEFSFVLSTAGREYALLTQNTYQVFLAFSVVTMLLTPIVVASAPRAADALLRLRLPKRLVSGFYPYPEPVRAEGYTDHLVIIGFGLNGKNLAQAAKVAGVPYVIIEMNPETVRSERARGEPIFFGDATQELTLLRANVSEARTVVLAINDPTATRRITKLVRGLNPKVALIVRTRYVAEIGPLYELGAEEVIPEEFETSVEIFTRVLSRYLIPQEEIESLVAAVRAEGYGMFRSVSWTETACPGLKTPLPDVEIVVARVCERSVLAGQSLADIGLRKNYDVTVLAVHRASETVSNPDADTRVEPEDVLILLGKPGKLRKAISLLSKPRETEGPPRSKD